MIRKGNKVSSYRGKGGKKGSPRLEFAENAFHHGGKRTASQRPESKERLGNFVRGLQSLIRKRENRKKKKKKSRNKNGKVKGGAFTEQTVSSEKKVYAVGRHKKGRGTMQNKKGEAFNL